jgi:hypothetical protein
LDEWWRSETFTSFIAGFRSRCVLTIPEFIECKRDRFEYTGDSSSGGVCEYSESRACIV